MTLNDSQKDSLKRILAKYGYQSQCRQSIEELSELIKELCKFMRGRDNIHELIDEWIDVNIMQHQIYVLLCNTLLEENNVNDPEKYIESLFIKKMNKVMNKHDSDNQANLKAQHVSDNDTISNPLDSILEYNKALDQYSKVLKSTREKLFKILDDKTIDIDTRLELLCESNLNLKHKYTPSINFFDDRKIDYMDYINHIYQKGETVDILGFLEVLTERNENYKIQDYKDMFIFEKPQDLIDLKEEIIAMRMPSFVIDW